MKLTLTFSALTFVAAWFSFQAGRSWNDFVLGEDNRLLTKAVEQIGEERVRMDAENKQLKEIINRLERQKR